MSRYKLGWRSSCEGITEVSERHIFAAQPDVDQTEDVSLTVSSLIKPTASL